MPVDYTIDVPRRFIMTVASGEVTTAEMMNHQNRLMRDPDFDPAFYQLADFSGVTRVSIQPDDIRLLAIRNFFSEKARRCFVAPTSEIFGLARMFQIFRELSGAKEQVRVFRNRKEAMLWLFDDEKE